MISSWICSVKGFHCNFCIQLKMIIFFPGKTLEAVKIDRCTQRKSGVGGAGAGGGAGGAGGREAALL